MIRVFISSLDSVQNPFSFCKNVRFSLLTWYIHKKHIFLFISLIPIIISKTFQKQKRLLFENQKRPNKYTTLTQKYSHVFVICENEYNKIFTIISFFDEVFRRLVLLWNENIKLKMPPIFTQNFRKFWDRKSNSFSLFHGRQIEIYKKI